MTKTFLLLTAIKLTTTVGMGKELDSPTNSLRPGDRLTEQRIVFQDLGRSGENVLWNLGEVEVEDGRYKLRYSAVRDSLHEWIAGTEHRTMYYYDQSAGDGIRIAGLENHTTFIHYDEQEMWLPLPLQYGDSVSGIFTGRCSYCGKELDRMHGLDWYDYGARHYDAALLRWHTVDPLCEKYYHISPYAFCGNNFVNAFDYNGMDTINISYYVKEFGEGMNRICREQEASGAQAPSFRTDEFILKITVPKVAEKETENEPVIKGKLTENGKELPEKLPETGDGATEKIEKLLEKARLKGDRLTENKITILRYMLEDPYISKSALAEVIGISYTAVGNNIKAMCGKYLRCVGPDKGGFWEILY